MKKLTLAVTTSLFLLAFTGNAIASPAVSHMATVNGGQTVAECAQYMDQGVSECAQNPNCNEL